EPRPSPQPLLRIRSSEVAPIGSPLIPSHGRGTLAFRAVTRLAAMRTRAQGTIGASPSSTALTMPSVSLLSLIAMPPILAGVNFADFAFTRATPPDGERTTLTTIASVSPLRMYIGVL